MISLMINREAITIMKDKRTPLEEKYLDEIEKIWRGRDKIDEKINKSMLVIASTEKIKWPKSFPDNLVRLGRVSLKLTLLQAAEENIMNKFPNIEISDVKNLFLETQE